MIQKCSTYKILEVFFKKPTAIHFIREIGREIRLAPTSVRIKLNELLKEGLIIKKESRPFDGYVANRESDLFIFYKRACNFLSLYDLNKEIIEKVYPRAIILFGSYSLGTDIEKSDIDILVLSKIKKEIKTKKFEQELDRKINIITLDNLKKLDSAVRKNLKNGIVLYGENE